MDKAAYDAFHESIVNGPQRGDYAGLSLAVVRGLSLEQGIEVGEYLERWLKAVPDHIGHNDDRELILCHLAALIPGCEERFKRYLQIEPGEEALFPRECIRLVHNDPPHAGARAVVGTQHEGTCGFCGRRLLTLLDLDLMDPRLAFMGLDGTRLRIPMCQCCDGMFCDVDLDGAAVWRPQNQRPDITGADFEYPGPSRVTFVLGPPRRTFEAHASITWLGTSQIGGYPTWIQEPRYPKCPKCAQAMSFVRQVERGAALLHGGIIYCHLCRSY